MPPRGNSRSLSYVRWPPTYARMQTLLGKPICKFAPLQRLHVVIPCPLVAGLLAPWLLLGDSTGPGDCTAHAVACTAWPAARSDAAIPEAGAACCASGRHAPRHRNQVWRDAYRPRKSESPAGRRAVYPRTAGARDSAGSQAKGRRGSGEWPPLSWAKRSRPKRGRRAVESADEPSGSADEPSGAGEGVARGGSTAAEELRAAPTER